MTKKSTIQIHDSKGGKFRVKLYRPNNEQLSVTQPLGSHVNVIKNILAQDGCFNGKLERYKMTIQTLGSNYAHITDHTKSQYFATKYGWESGKQSKKK